MPAEVDFWTRYSSLCSKTKVCPLRSIFRRLKGTELCCPVEVIRSEHWPLFLAALGADSSLTKLQFASDIYPAVSQEKNIGEKKRRSGLQFPIPYGCSEKNVSDICKCVAHLLCSSKELKILKIENLCLKEEDALILEKAFKDSSVEHFSFSGCKLQDDAFEIICRGLQLSNVQWVDFSSCGIQAFNIPFICKIIKAHNIRRSSELFPHTLRYQLPVLDDIKGLSRITLNNNKIGDEAVEMLVINFCEDFWIKALDLQKCCIGNDGAKSLLNVAKRNIGLQLIDLRLNDIDEKIIDRIALQIALNNVAKFVKHDLGCLWKPSKKIKRISCRKAYLKTKVLKYSPPKGRALNKESVRVPVKITNSKTSSEDASSQTSINYNKDLKKTKKIITKYNNLLHTLKKYKRENHLLHQEVENLSSQDDYLLIDHQTFSEVTSTFEKFKKFLDIMKEYGLWECIAMLEENESLKNILRPLILEATKKCIKIAKGDSSSEKASQSNDSVPLSSLENEMVQFPKQFDRSYNHKQVNQSQMKYDNMTESKLFYSRVLPEMNYVKKTMPSDKALAHKVFREVMESYTSSSHSSDRINPMPQHLKAPVHTKQKNMSHISGIKSSISETETKLQQLNASKGRHNGISNHYDQSVTYPKTLQSPLVSMHGTNNNTQESVVKVGCEKTSGSAIKPIAEISLSSNSSSKNSSEGSSTLRKSNKEESDHSSAYKSLPEIKQKMASLPDNDIELSSKKQSIATTSQSNNKSSLPSENQTSESESPKSSRTSKSKVSSHKSKSATSSRKHISSVSEHSLPNVPSNKRIPEFSSSTSSVRSYSGKNSIKESVHSSVDGINSEKSYLESVSEASTDKDVKSLSESEVYSSDRSKKDSKMSLQTKDDPKTESSVPQAEMHSELVQKVIHSNSTKSSETKLTQKKASAGKPEKDNKSESSVPSLSDITTVSSHSLNTDSVMGQLSDD